MIETALYNARVVLADEVVVASVLLRDGVIADIGTPGASGEDMGGWPERVEVLRNENTPFAVGRN
jgi:hypothetical protein